MILGEELSVLFGIAGGVGVGRSGLSWCDGGVGGVRVGDFRHLAMLFSWKDVAL